jgi:hypothetical protein
MRMNHYYDDIQGWFCFADIYAQAVKRVPDGGTLVELGVWKGKSLSFLLVEAANSRKKLRIVGVDHFKGSAGEPPLQHEAAAINLHKVATDNAKRSGYPFELLREASPDAAKRFADKSLDFVFIDASHTYDCVAADIKAWLPKVKPGGMIAGDDYGYPGVSQAVSEAFGEAVQSNGGTWWFTVAEAAEPVEDVAKPEVIPAEPVLKKKESSHEPTPQRHQDAGRRRSG